MNTKLVQNWCNQFKLCKGCKFVGNECVVKDGETGNTSVFYDRMVKVIEQTQDTPNHESYPC